MQIGEEDARLRIDKLVWWRCYVEIEGIVHKGSVEVGFSERAKVAATRDRLKLRLPRPEKSAGLTLTFGDTLTHDLPPPGRPREALTRLTVLPAVLAEVWQNRGAILFFLRSGDASVAAKLRRQFGLTPPSDIACVIPKSLFGAASLAEPSAPATIVIPIFNAADDTERLLGLLPDTLDSDTRIVLVDDGSEDKRIAPLLERFAAGRTDVKVIRHKTNLGFVAAANAGLSAAHRDDHVILLNTDTIPPPGWVRRLLAPIIADASVASVTPLSNNAEILSVPHAGIETAPTADMVAVIDRAAQRLAPRDVTLPTGIGFCIALNRSYLARNGGFDPTFGRGYGEEVDWCQRATKAGGRHVAQTRLFVGHRGGASFGACKAARIRAAGRIIAERYPAYDADVQDWIADAPVAPERLVLALSWLGAVSGEPVPVFLGHSLGGGAETALQAEVDAFLSDGAPGVVVLRVGGPRAWRVELYGAGFTLAGDPENAVLLHRFLASLPNRRVIYSCGVGASDPGAVPRLLAEVSDGTPLELRLHDFFPISPSWNLLDSGGSFRGVPRIDSTDAAHQVRAGPGREALSYREWRQLWARVVCRSDRIVAFAPSGRRLLADAYPEVADKIVVRPHETPTLPERLALGGRTVGILGGINRAKGGAVLVELAKRTPRRLVVIGEMDGQFRLPRPHVVHGRYDQAQITDLARRYDIGLWLIPSICPETFSFATHEALATGLPVLSFDLGAQADALRLAGNGHVLDISTEDAAALAEQIEQIWLVSPG